MALSPKQKRYCRERASGKCYADAFKDAGYGPNSSRHSQRQNAFRLEHYQAHAAEIQAEIKRLQDLADKKAILKREERQALLTQFALDENNDMPDRLRSIDQLNRMFGDYTDKVQTEVAGKIDLDYQDKLAAIQQAIAESE